MMDGLIYAKNPMAKRIPQLHSDLPITVIYGEKSLIYQMPDPEFQKLRPKNSYIDIHVRI